MSPEEVNKFIKCFHEGKIQSEKRLLLSLRAKILDDVHKGQDKLYCLDYLIKKLDLK